MATAVSSPLEIVYVQHSLIVPNPLQPRQTFDEGELQDLATSIAEHGVLQPMLVRPGRIADTGEEGYWLIAGERRWRASGIVGLYEVPVIIRDVTVLEGGILATIENLQRAQLTPLEEADQILNLLAAGEESGEPMSIATLGKRLGKGKGEGWIKNRLELLQVGEDVREMVAKRSDALSHAREINSIRNEPLRTRLINFTVDGAALKVVNLLAYYIREAGPYAREDELEDFIDLYGRSHGKLGALEQKIQQRLEQVAALRGTTRAPDSQTGFRSRQNAQSGGGGMSRGRHITGASKAQASKEIKDSTSELRRHVMNITAWKDSAGGLTAENRRDLNEARHLIEELLTEPSRSLPH